MINKTLTVFSQNYILKIKGSNPCSFLKVRYYFLHQHSEAKTVKKNRNLGDFLGLAKRFFDVGEKMPCRKCSFFVSFFGAAKNEKEVQLKYNYCAPNIRTILLKSIALYLDN